MRTRAAEFKANGDAAPLVTLLQQTAARLQKTRRTTRDEQELVDLLHAVRAIATLDMAQPAREAWRVAAAACHDAGLSILSDALDGALPPADQVAGLSLAVIDSRCGRAHVWLIKNADQLWTLAQKAEGPAPPDLRQAFETSFRTLGAPELNDDSRKAAGALAGWITRRIAAPQRPVDLELLKALAKAPGRTSRKLWRKWMQAQRNLDEKSLADLLASVAEGADNEAVDVLLAYVEGSSPAVLEAALVGLSKLPPAVLKKKGKKIIGTTMRVAEVEGRASRKLASKPRRTAKQEAELDRYKARYNAWQTSKIVDDPPTKLPAGVRGVTGIHALWWRVIEARPGGIRPPQPSKRAYPKYINGRPNLSGADWLNWWRGK